MKKLTRLLMKRVSRLDKRTSWDEISIVLMDDADIARVNSQCLDRFCPTDVLAFRYQRDHGVPGHASGEIILNVERAISEGSRRGGASAELALYLAHGCDHLAGEDDDGAANRRRMRARETRWLKQIGETLDLSQLLGNGEG